MSAFGEATDGLKISLDFPRQLSGGYDLASFATVARALPGAQ